MKKIIIIALLLIQNLQAKSEIDIVVIYKSDKEIERTETCKLEIRSGEELIGEYKFENDKQTNMRKEPIFSTMNKSEFNVKFIANRIEEQSFEINNNTKRIEIYLSYDLSKGGDEYLRDFTIKRILYPKSDVKLERLHKSKIGHQPVYRIINFGNYNYHGQSATRHFYGTLHQLNSENNWSYHTSGSYCRSTVHEKVLSKGDTVYAWIPSYSYGDEYKFKSIKKKYKFSVLLGLEPYKGGVPIKMYNEAITRKRLIELIELEDEFEIEK